MKWWQKGILTTQIALISMLSAPKDAHAQDDLLASNDKFTPPAEKKFNMPLTGRKFTGEYAAKKKAAEARIDWRDVIVFSDEVPEKYADSLRVALRKIEADSVGQVMFKNLKELHGGKSIRLIYSTNANNHPMSYSNGEINVAPIPYESIYVSTNATVSNPTLISQLAHEIAHAQDKRLKKIGEFFKNLPDGLLINRQVDSTKYDEQIKMMRSWAYSYQSLLQKMPEDKAKEHVLKQICTDINDPTLQEQAFEWVKKEVEYARLRIEIENDAVKIENYFYKKFAGRGHYLFSVGKVEVDRGAIHVGNDTNSELRAEHLAALVKDYELRRVLLAESCSIMDFNLEHAPFTNKESVESMGEKLEELYQNIAKKADIKREEVRLPCLQGPVEEMKPHDHITTFEQRLRDRTEKAMEEQATPPHNPSRKSRGR